MKNPMCIKIAALLLALSFIEPRAAYADAMKDATDAANDIDAAYTKAQENIPDKDIKENEDALDKAAQDNDNTQGDPAKDPSGKGDPAKDPAKEKAKEKEDKARTKADEKDPDKKGAPYRQALLDRREACKKLKKALADLFKLKGEASKKLTDTTPIVEAINAARKAEQRQKKVPEAPTLSMVAPQRAPTVATLVASGKIKVDSAGTGETIGHVADLKIQNLTDQPLTCAIAPTILESGSGKNQHYACPSGQTVALNPHQTKTVPMNGVCLNRNKPPVGKGVSGDLVINEANPSGPQNPNSHIPANQAGDLLRICTSKYDAADQLQKSGALKNLPYHDPQKQKDIVVQWSTWCDPRISQITGAPPATKDDLKKVVYKQVEEKGPMSPDTKKKVDQGIDTIFEKVELTTAKAKDLEKPQAEISPAAGPAVAETPSPRQPEFVSQTAAVNPVGATVANDPVHNAKKNMTKEEFVAWLNGLIGAWANEIAKIDAEEKAAKDAGKKWPGTAKERGRQMRRDLLKEKKRQLEAAKEAAPILETAKTLADKALADVTVVEMGADLIDFAADLLGYKDIPLPALSSALKGLKALFKTEKVVKAIEAAEKAAEAYEKAKELKEKAEKLKELKEKVDDVKKALEKP